MEMSNFEGSNLIWCESVCRSCVGHGCDGRGWHCHRRDLKGRDELPVGMDCEHYIGALGTEKGGRESYLCVGVEFGVEVYEPDFKRWELVVVPRDYCVADRVEIAGDADADDRTICEKLVDAWRVSDPGRKFRVCVRGVTKWCELKREEAV